MNRNLETLMQKRVDLGCCRCVPKRINPRKRSFSVIVYPYSDDGLGAVRRTSDLIQDNSCWAGDMANPVSDRQRPYPHRLHCFHPLDKPGASASGEFLTFWDGSGGLAVPRVTKQYRRF